MDCKELVEHLKSPTWQDLEDPDSSLLTDAATAITDLLARAEAAEARCKLAEKCFDDSALHACETQLELEKKARAETEARCARLEEARENANEACAKWETLCHMAEQERDTYKAVLQNWHEEG